MYNAINNPNVSFEGEKSSHELDFYYNTNMFTLLPGSEENFPLVGLEAMSCGSIVISHINGFSNYIEDGTDGILFPNCSPSILYNFFEQDLDNLNTEK